MYLVYSVDHFLLKKQVEKIVKKQLLESEIQVYSWIDDNLQRIYEDVNTVGFFTQHKTIIINDCLFLTSQTLDEKKYPNKNQKELMLKILASKNDQTTVIFSVEIDKISTKTKLAQKFIDECQVIQVPLLDDAQLQTYVSQRLQTRKKKITEQHIKYFLTMMPNDLVAINHEIEKFLALQTSVIDRNIIEQNVCKYREVNIFNLAEAFINEQSKAFILQLSDYFELNNDFMSLIYLLASELVFTRDCFLLQQQQKSSQTIATLLNAHPYRIKMTFKKYKHLDIDTLNDKILVLYHLNSLLVQGSINPEIIAKLELIKVIEREN